MTFEQTLLRPNPIAPIGIASVILATLLAILFVPDAFWQPGALQLSAAILTIGLLAPPAFEIVRHRKAVIRADYLLFVAIVYWIFLDLLQGKNEPRTVSIEAVRYSFLGIGLFAAGIWTAGMFQPWRLPVTVKRAAEATLSNQVLEIAILGCFLLGMAHYVISCQFDFELLFSSLLNPRFAAPWQANLGRLGGWTAFQYHLVYFGYLVPTLTILIAHRSGWLSPGCFMGMLASMCILAFATQSGTRGEVGVIFGAAFLSWLLLQPKINTRVFVSIVVFLVALLLWFEVMLAARSGGFGQFLESGKTDLISTDKINVDDNFNRLSQVMYLMPDRVEHTLGGQLWYTVVRPIPRAVWPDKPMGPGFSFEEEVGQTQATWSVTTVGEFYYDFGLPFVFIGGFLYGRMAGMWNQLLISRRGIVWPVLYGLGAMALFVGVRSQQAMSVRLYPILFWLVLHNLFLKGSETSPVVRRARAA